MPEKARKPRAKKLPTQARKGPFAERVPEPVADRVLVWRMARLDLGGRWGWERFQQTHGEQLRRLMTVYEETPLHKLRPSQQVRGIPVEHLCLDAQRRLEEIGQDDLEELHELRLGHDKWRVWGILNGKAFDIVWWDPTHKVCPKLPPGKRRHGK